MIVKRQQISMADILCELQKDINFKKMHQRRDKIDILSKFQNTYGEMIKLIRRMESRNTTSYHLDIQESLKTGSRIFLYYEHKIFTWISAWILSKQSISINQINTFDIYVLTTMFPSKDPAFLRYQFFLETSKANHTKTVWDEERDNALLSVINHENSYNLKSLSSWKFFSFQLFTKQGYTITPKECRDRWESHLNPTLNKEKWTKEQDRKLLELYQKYGSKWSVISQKLQTRNQHMVKNRVNSIKHKIKKDQLRSKHRHLSQKSKTQEGMVLLQPESSMFLFHKRDKQDQNQLLKIEEYSPNIVFYPSSQQRNIISELSSKMEEYSVKQEQNN